MNLEVDNGPGLPSRICHYFVVSGQLLNLLASVLTTQNGSNCAHHTNHAVKTAYYVNMDSSSTEPG